MERNMYLDKEKAVKAFMGTGEKNAAGEDLVTFLEKYDPHKYQNPCNTVDMAVFAYNESEKKVTKVLLIQRGNHPSIGWWALPGGFVEYRENLETAAARELQEETGIEHLSFEQLKHMVHMTGTRVRGIITTAYIALVPEGLLQEKAGDDAKKCRLVYNKRYRNFKRKTTQTVQSARRIGYALKIRNWQSARNPRSV